MLISSRRHEAARLMAGAEVALIWSEVTQHVPAELVERALRAALEAEVDVLIAIGGGSAIELAKAIARDTAIPIIAIPATFAGSEATDVWGITTSTVTTTGSAPSVLPRMVIYDADLAGTLPLDLAMASAMNAIAHCVDSLWAPGADPINAALAGEATTALAAGIRSLATAGVTTSAVETMQYGAYLAAVAFASAGSGLHHKICHVLGGRYDLRHAATHAVVLPYVLALNIDSAPEVDRRLRAGLEVDDSLTGILHA
jgi:maleylacetate reductase